MSYPNYGPGYYGPPQSHPNGTTILVPGILSLVVCQILGPFAWSMGNKALQEIDASGHHYENRGQIQAGKICGMISTILMIASLGIVLVFVGIALVGGAFTSTSY